MLRPSDSACMHALSPYREKDMQIAAGRQGVWRFHVDFPT
jgi:hypothetical protein